MTKMYDHEEINDMFYDASEEYGTCEVVEFFNVEDI